MGRSGDGKRNNFLGWPYKRYNENLFLAAADDVLGRIFHFSFDPIQCFSTFTGY